jgi:hypothetical protein
MITGLRRTQMPPVGVPVDLTHPLVTGLGMRGFYACNSKSGSSLPDLLKQVNLTTTGFGTTNPWSAGSMPGLLCGITSAFATGTIPASLQLPFPLWLAWSGRVLATQTANCGVFGLLFNSAGTSPFDVLDLFINSSNKYAIAWNSNGTPQSLVSATAPTIGADVVLFAVATPTSQEIWLNGTQIASASGALSAPHYSATSQVTFGPGGGTSADEGTLNYWGAWGTANPTTSIIQAISANPNAIWSVVAPQYNAALMGGNSVGSSYSGAALLPAM